MVLGGLLCLLALAAPSTTASQLPPRYRAWMQVMRGHVPVPPDVQIRGKVCPGSDPSNVGGCIWGSAGIWVNPARPLPTRRFSFAHELAHLYDEQLMTDRQRRRYRQIMGDPRTWWETSPPGPPAEQFAEAYARCALPGRIWPAPAYGFRPTGRQMRLVCRMLRAAR